MSPGWHGANFLATFPRGRSISCIVTAGQSTLLASSIAFREISRTKVSNRRRKYFISDELLDIDGFDDELEKTVGSYIA